MDDHEIDELFRDPGEDAGDLFAGPIDDIPPIQNTATLEPLQEPIPTQIDPQLSQATTTQTRQIENQTEEFSSVPWEDYVTWMNIQLCFYWTPNGFTDVRLPVQASRSTADALLQAVGEERLYISQQPVKSPYEALTAACWVWQKQGILPAPADLTKFEHMTPHERCSIGMTVPLTDNWTHDLVLRPVVNTLQRLEEYSRYTTGSSTQFQLGIIREEVRDNTPTITAKIPFIDLAVPKTTIWIHQRLYCDKYGNVRSQWSAIGDGTVPPPPTPPQPLPYTGKGKKRARSLSPDPTFRKRLQPSPSPFQNAPQQPPLPPNPTAAQLQAYYFPIPFPIESDRRSQVLVGGIPPTILLDPAICPKEYILPGAKLLTNTIIIHLAQHFSNTDIFTRINQILSQPRSTAYGDGEEWTALRDANVITRRITVAVESEAKRRGVDAAEVRREIETGRKMNGVVTGRGKGVRKKKQATTEDGKMSAKKEGKMKAEEEPILDDDILSLPGYEEVMPSYPATENFGESAGIGGFGDWLQAGSSQPYFTQDDWMDQYLDTLTPHPEEEEDQDKTELPFEFDT